MSIPHRARLSEPRRMLLGVATLAAALVALAPAGAQAATLTFGSPLSVAATLNTAENLDYQGLNTPVPVSPEAPDGVFHTFHFGADTAIWNTDKQAVVPAGGQVIAVRLEGCALPAPHGPAPLNQIHFQILSPTAGGGASVVLTSQGLEIPTCGQGGAGGTTVTSYEPINMCVVKGDYVAFNDEGGYVEGVYHAGVPYEVLGAVRGASADSFIRNDGTGDGASFAPGDTSAMDGFAVNRSEELMMQTELGTGADARYVCPGGSKEAPPVLPEIRISPQTDGINEARIIEVAVYCRPTSGCPGTATLTLPDLGRSASRAVGRASFDLAGNDTGHIPIRVSPQVLKLIRKHGGVKTTMVAEVGGQTFTQSVQIKIL